MPHDDESEKDTAVDLVSGIEEMRVARRQCGKCGPVMDFMRPVAVIDCDYCPEIHRRGIPPSVIASWLSPPVVPLPPAIAGRFSEGPRFTQFLPILLQKRAFGRIPSRSLLRKRKSLAFANANRAGA